MERAKIDKTRPGGLQVCVKPGDQIRIRYAGKPMILHIDRQPVNNHSMMFAADKSFGVDNIEMNGSVHRKRVYIGQVVIVANGGELLSVYISKRNGSQYSLVFHGPKSFEVKRIPRDEKKDPQAD